MLPTSSPEITRRSFLAGAVAAGGAALATNVLGSGQALAQTSSLIMKKIPRTGEPVPAVGLGTFMTFDIKPGGPRDNVREIMRRFWEGGGRVIDTSPLYGMSEVNVGHFATALGITKDIFITNKIWATGEWLSDDRQAVRQLETSMSRLWRDKIDVMQVHSLVNTPVILDILRGWKREGRIRYLGVTHHELPYFPALARTVETAKELDFVQVHYSILIRNAEERILPAAADRGIAVQVNMPFEKARLFKIVEGHPLPPFAADIGCANWAQFFLKFIISHPAVTCAIPATTNPDHESENIGALKGPLPDAAMRAQMVKYVESLPGADKLAQMPMYPGKKFDGVVRLAPRN